MMSNSICSVLRDEHDKNACKFNLRFLQKTSSKLCRPASGRVFIGMTISPTFFVVVAKNSDIIN